MAKKREEMLSFLRKTIKKNNIESLTKRNLREKFLKSIRKKSLSADELKTFSSAVDRVCNELMKDHAGSRSSSSPTPPAKKSKQMRHVSSSSNESADDQSERDLEFTKESFKKKTKVANRTGNGLNKSTKALKMKTNEDFLSDNSEDVEQSAKRIVASSDDEDFVDEKSKDTKTKISVPDVHNSFKGRKGDFKRNVSASKDYNESNTRDENKPTKLKNSSDSEADEPLVKPKTKKSIVVSNVESSLDSDNDDEQAKKNDKNATTSDTEPLSSPKSQCHVKDSSDSEADKPLVKPKTKKSIFVSNVESSLDSDNDDEQAKKNDKNATTSDTEPLPSPKDSSDSEADKPLVRPTTKKSIVVLEVGSSLDSDNNDEKTIKNNMNATTSDTEPLSSPKSQSQAKDSSDTEAYEPLVKKSKLKSLDVVSTVELSSDNNSDKEKVRKHDKNDNISDTDPLGSPVKSKATKESLHAKDLRKSKALVTPKSRKSNIQASSDHSTDENSDSEILSEVRKKASDIKKRKRSSGSSSKSNDTTKKSVMKKKLNTFESADSTDEFSDEVKSAEKKGRAQSKSTGKEDPKITRMKRYINVAGLRFFYAKLFENCKSTKSKVQKLQEVLKEAGLKGKPTLEKCKRLQRKRAKKHELAELDPDNILTNDTGRTRRRTHNPFQTPPSQPQAIAAANPIKHTFSRLKGIVDSEESSD